MTTELVELADRIEWLERFSDHGQHMKIRGPSAGEAYELAQELRALASRAGGSGGGPTRLPQDAVDLARLILRNHSRAYASGYSKIHEDDAVRAMVYVLNDRPDLPPVDWFATQLCEARNQWCIRHEEDWLETGDNHPDDWIAKFIRDAMLAAAPEPVAVGSNNSNNDEESV